MYRKKGFTLIELLVVISIIALLLSILTPALQQVKEQAKKTICRSNQRQIYIGSMEYSQSNNEVLLMGYQWDTKQYNYVVWDGGYVVWGPLYEGEYIESQKSWHCPAYKNNWSEVTEVWPPEDLISGKIDPADVLEFAAVSTYGSRPDIEWIITPEGKWEPEKNIKWADISSRKAYISDWCSDSFVFSRGHEGGLNVLSLDGHAEWLSIDESRTFESFGGKELSLEEILEMMDGPWGPWFNDDMDRIWEIFDNN